MTALFYDWYGYNTMLFYLINGVRDARLDVFMQVGAILGNPLYLPVYGVLLLVASMYWAIRYGQYQAWSGVTAWCAVALTFVAATYAGLYLTAYIHQLVDFARPAAALGAEAVKSLGPSQGSHHSLPSGHALFTMTFVFSVWPLMAAHQKLAGALFVGWVGVAQVYAGAHFPVDVIAGWLLALVLVALIRRVIGYLVHVLVTWIAGRLARRARLL